MSEISRDTQIDALKHFKRRRDSLLNEDVKQLDNHLAPLMSFLKNNPFVQSVLASLLQKGDLDYFTTWLDEEYEKLDMEVGGGIWKFPDDPEDEFYFQYQLLQGYENNHERNFIDLADRRNRYSDMDGSKNLFLSLVVRPFCLTLGDKLEAAIGMPSQEARELLAVPIERIPGVNETRIFLSHKSKDKERVKRYCKVLDQLGYQPWLDESDMPAGTRLNKGILDGINESCAVVFFITKNFRDERILADEIDYAKTRKTEQGEKFSIIILKFPDSADVPELFKTYVWKDVNNDLDGLHEIIRALPIELGPVHWKERAVR